MTNEGMTVIEINGVKLEVDLRQARRIDNLKVGDRVKVLRKEPGYSTFEVHHGMLIGFDEFKELPTLIVAYMKTGYDGGLKFLFYNAKSVDTEIIASRDSDMIGIEKDQVLRTMDRNISSKEVELQVLKDQKTYFLSNFQAYWAPMEATLKAMEGK